MLQCFQKNFKIFFDPEKVKKQALKVAHNRPRPFYFTVQPRPTAHSPELIFHIMKSRDQTSVLLSVEQLTVFYCTSAVIQLNIFAVWDFVLFLEVLWDQNVRISFVNYFSMCYFFFQNSKVQRVKHDCDCTVWICLFCKPFFSKQSMSLFCKMSLVYVFSSSIHLLIQEYLFANCAHNRLTF